MRHATLFLTVLLLGSLAASPAHAGPNNKKKEREAEEALQASPACRAIEKEYDLAFARFEAAEGAAVSERARDLVDIRRRYKAACGEPPKSMRDDLSKQVRKENKEMARDAREAAKDARHDAREAAKDAKHDARDARPVVPAVPATAPASGATAATPPAPPFKSGADAARCTKLLADMRATDARFAACGQDKSCRTREKSGYDLNLAVYAGQCGALPQDLKKIG